MAEEAYLMRPCHGILLAVQRCGILQREGDLRMGEKRRAGQSSEKSRRAGFLNKF